VYERDVVPSGQMINLLLQKIHDLNHKAMLAPARTLRNSTQDVTRFMIFGTVLALLFPPMPVINLAGRFWSRFNC